VNRSTKLNFFFALATIAVAGALAWVAWHCVDSAQNHADQMTKINLTPENTMIANNSFKGVPESVTQMVIPDEQKTPDEMALYRGSEIIFHRGLDKQKRKQWDSAIADFSKVIEMVPEEGKTKKTWYGDGEMLEQSNFIAFSYQMRAYCYAQKRQYEPAVADLTVAIKMQPFEPVSYENRAKAYYCLGRKKLGDADIVKVREIRASNDLHDFQKF